MDIAREVRVLKVCLGVVAVVLVALAGMMAVRGQSDRQRFTEIDVERINIIEQDGKLKMVITNEERFPDVPIDGRVFKRGPDQKYPGIVFFNSNGDESGGLTFRSRQLPGGAVEANASLNFDQYRHDRTLQLMYGEYDKKRMAGLAILDRPEVPIGELIDRIEAARALPEGPDKAARLEAIAAEGGDLRRVFIGKDLDRSARLVLSDPNGRPRLVLSVDVAGTPKLEFLDEAGRVTQSLPAK